MKDERISSLLDSNNELSLELTHKNQAIESLKNEILLLKKDTERDKVQENLLKSLVKKINDRKNSYETAFKGKEYLTISCKDDMDYIESINVPPETEITTVKALEKHSEISAKLKSMLSKFHKERDNYLKGNSERSTVTYPANEPQPYETVETTVTYESFDDDPSSPCDDLSTQTDDKKKNSTLVSEMNEKKLQIKQHINVFKEKYPSVIVRFEEDIDYVESIDISVSSMNITSMKLNSIEQKFANLIKSYANRIVTLDQLQKMISKVSNQKANILGSLSKFRNEFKVDFDYAESIELPKVTDAMHPEDIERSYESAKAINIRLNMLLSKLNDTIKKLNKKKSTKSESSSEVACSSTEFRSERSTLFQDQPMKDSESKTKDDLSTQTDFTPTKIVKAYTHQSTDTDDLSKGSPARSIDDIELIHKEIFAQLESKVKSTLNFEIDAAIKKTSESLKNLQVSCNCPDKDQLQVTKQQLGEKQSIINELDHKFILCKNDVKRCQSMLSDRDSTIAETKKNLKEKESEISKLQKKVANQTNTNRQQQIAMDAKCKEMEKLKKSSSQQTSQVEVNKLKSKIRQVLN